MIGRGWVGEPGNSSANGAGDANGTVPADGVKDEESKLAPANKGEESAGAWTGKADKPARARARDEEPGRVWTNDDFSIYNDLADDDLTADDLVLAMPTRPVVGPAIRRNVRWLCAAGLLGLLVGGALYTKVIPPPYKATSSVLLIQPPASDAADVMLTEAAIAESHTVAEAAMRKLGVPVNAKSVQAFLSDYTAVSLSDRVLQFTTKATSSATALDRAQALAGAFLRVRSAELNSELAATISAINQQIGQERQHVSSLGQQISALAKDPVTPARQAQIAGLKAQQSVASTTLTGLTTAAKGYETTQNVANASVVDGSGILDKATPTPRSRFKYPVMYIGGGLAGGLAVGLGLIALIALVSTRLRRRDDIARTLGAPVRLSLGRVRLARQGMAAAERPEIRQIVAHLRRLVPARSSGAATLALATIDAPDVAAVSLVSLALSYARDGKRVIVADLTPDAAAGQLLGRTEPGVHNVTMDGQQLVIARPEPDDLAPIGPVPGPASATDDAYHPSRPLDRVYAAGEVLLTLTVLDPALGADHLPTWASDCALILTAGESSITRIHTIGQMIRLAGVSLVSAILLGAEKNDVSLGVPELRVPGWTAGEVAEQPAPELADGLAAERDGARSEVAPTIVSN
jgi:capsular polysaccharide biosynthesis protein